MSVANEIPSIQRAAGMNYAMFINMHASMPNSMEFSLQLAGIPPATNFSCDITRELALRDFLALAPVALCHALSDVLPYSSQKLLFL